VYHAKYQNINVPSIPLHVSGWQICWWLHFLSTIMVILQRQRLELYKKASFVHYSMEINCTSLRFIMITVTVFWLVWIGALPDDTIHIWTAALISSLQVFVPHCSQNITLKLWKLPVLVQQPEVLLHTDHTHFYTPPKPIFSDVANMKALVPSILHLQTQENVNIQQYRCITIIQDLFDLKHDIFLVD